MNKAIVDKEIPAAYEALKHAGIVKKDKAGNLTNDIDKTYRGQIETFGAAITMGSLRAAIAFFSTKGGSDVDRPKLIAAIMEILRNRPESGFKGNKSEQLIDFVSENEDRAKKEIISAAVALKLAMNLYNLVDTKKQTGKL